MKHAVFTLLASCIVSLSVAQSKRSVIEVSTVVYDKPLTGFRFMIPLPARVFREVIHDHFAARNFHSADLEHIVLYEQVLCPEISLEHPVSLFFLLHPLSDQATQVTVCALYDHTRCITLTDAPDLAMRLMMEVSAITESAQYGALDLSSLFSKVLPQDIRERYLDRRERLEQTLYLNAGPILQSGETQAITMNTSPFSNRPADEILPPADQALAEVLSERFTRYVAGNPPPAPAIAGIQPASVQALRDSFELVLRNERNLQQRQQSQIRDMEEQLACFDPESQQAQQQLRAYKHRIAEANALEADLAARAARLRAQEKLNEQRLRYLTEYEQDRDAVVLLNRIRELEAALQRLEFAQFESMRN